MSAESLTPYSELAAVIDNLPLLVREARRARGLSLRAAGEQVGIAYSVLSRVENGQRTMQAHCITAILRWLDTTGATPDGPPELTEAETLTAIDAAPQTVPCTQCGADVGQECRSPAGRPPSNRTHLARRVLAITIAREAKGWLR